MDYNKTSRSVHSFQHRSVICKACKTAGKTSEQPAFDEDSFCNVVVKTFDPTRGNHSDGVRKYFAKMFKVL